jgi:hypothetical protein
VQANAEHKKGGADLRQLRCESDIRDVAWCCRIDERFGHQITNQWRDPQTIGERVKIEGASRFSLSKMSLPSCPHKVVIARAFL